MRLVLFHEGPSSDIDRGVLLRAAKHGPILDIGSRRCDKNFKHFQ